VEAAEKSLAGATPSAIAFARAAELTLTGARGYEHNAFKLELAKQGIARALTLASTASMV
jgi:xanthine dehydrogenase YagS FAD-binding subunit